LQICGTEQLGVVLGQPCEQRRPPKAEAGLRVEGPDDRDELQVRWPQAGELEVDQRADVAAVDQDVAEVEVPVQQDLVVICCRVSQIPQALGRRVQHAVVDERELRG
jgi:hypothetical protein